MDWRERTYYWVRLNNSNVAWHQRGHDDYGKKYERRVPDIFEKTYEAVEPTKEEEND